MIKYKLTKRTLSILESVMERTENEPFYLVGEPVGANGKGIISSLNRYGVEIGLVFTITKCVPVVRDNSSSDWLTLMFQDKPKLRVWDL